ncbi:hypothetical protein BT63DRAFT_452633 [Microthyrium microscopicum]|uniref:Uncharacterized protein n=1 Tax=Microthyrium microscopicum TaxID=703497 RepID=A0A6A6UL03_9PEZI|nr:hypothetical protein BT63DRAFT_452633 [Microthyrium microscopicum]
MSISSSARLSSIRINSTHNPPKRRHTHSKKPKRNRQTSPTNHHRSQTLRRHNPIHHHRHGQINILSCLRDSVRSIDKLPELGYYDAYSTYSASSALHTEVERFTKAIVAKKDGFIKAGAANKVYKAIGDYRDVIDTLYKAVRGKMPSLIAGWQGTKDSEMMANFKTAEKAI